HLFTAAPSMHPREFELLQMLLSTRRRETSDEDARRVLPYALGLINEFRLMIEAAVEQGALRPDEANPADDQSLSRTVRWAGALNGALLVSNAAAVPGGDAPQPIDPDVLTGGLLDGRVLALHLARDLLAGWGADPQALAAAEDFVRQLAARDRVAVAAPPVTSPDGAAGGRVRALRAARGLRAGGGADPRARPAAEDFVRQLAARARVAVAAPPVASPAGAAGGGAAPAPVEGCPPTTRVERGSTTPTDPG